MSRRAEIAARAAARGVPVSDVADVRRLAERAERAIDRQLGHPLASIPLADDDDEHGAVMAAAGADDPPEPRKSPFTPEQQERAAAARKAYWEARRLARAEGLEPPLGKRAAKKLRAAARAAKRSRPARELSQEDQVAMAASAAAAVIDDPTPPSSPRAPVVSPRPEAEELLRWLAYTDGVVAGVVALLDYATGALNWEAARRARALLQEVL